MFHFLVEHSTMQLNGALDKVGAEGCMSRKSPWENHSCLICHLKNFGWFLAEQSNLPQRKQHQNKQHQLSPPPPSWAGRLVLWSHTCLFNKHCSSIKSLYIMKSFIITRESVSIFCVFVCVCQSTRSPTLSIYLIRRNWLSKWVTPSVHIQIVVGSTYAPIPPDTESNQKTGDPQKTREMLLKLKSLLAFSVRLKGKQQTGWSPVEMNHFG